MRDEPRSSGDGLQKEYSDLSALVCDPEREEGASKTRQSDLASTDINNIVARYERAGLPLPTEESRFLDVSELPDFRSVLDQMNRATEYFMQLPAKSRAMFDNDVTIFLDRVNDPAQLELLVEAGVIPKDEVKVVETAEAISARAEAKLKSERRRARKVEQELDREDDGRYGPSERAGEKG